MIYLFLLPFFFAVMLLYLRTADHYNIIDHPNERSSHNRITIRGGGIIFIFAAIIALIWHSDYLLALAGIFIIGIISFLDDLYTLSNKVRILFHLIAVSLLFAHLNLFSVLPVSGFIFLYVLSIGIINAYNFMDGINGITGAYSLIILAGLQYVNIRQIHFVEQDMIWLPMLACFVFLYFNFRKNAKCFAGDVGSVTIAFWIIMLMLSLIFKSHNWAYILFLSVYGVDAVLTIIHRLWLKQNIFKAHRLHFYQVLANEQKIPHLLVSFFYAFIQLLIIVFIVQIQLTLWLDILVACLPLVLIYITLKKKLLQGRSS